MYNKNIITILLFVFVIGITGYIGIESVKRNKKMQEYKANLISQEIGTFSTDEIYLVDLASGAYRCAWKPDEITDDGNIKVSFLVTKKGRRIAEVMENPQKNTLSIKYPFGSCKLMLYDPNSGERLHLLEQDTRVIWKTYEISVDRMKKKIEIKKRK